MIPLEKAERATRQRPTVEGAHKAWLAAEGPTHAPSLAHRPLPARQWAVEGLVPFGAVTLFSGDGGSGKSTLALQLACSTVLGQRWLGRETKNGSAVYVSCEDDLDELHRRLDGICNCESWDIADLDGLELFDRVGRDNAVMMRGTEFGSVWEDTPWWIRFSNWIRDFAPMLVVLDSLYDFFPGNQLDQAAARTFMGKLRELAHDAGCAIVVLWHPSKSGMETGDGTSGNVAFRNAARSMLYLERADKDDPDGPRVIHTKKANYGPAADEVTVTWDGGRFVPLLPGDAPSSMFAGMARRSAERAFLDGLAALTKQGRRVNASRNTGNYAPRVMVGLRQTAGLKVADLEKAMLALFDAGAIVNQEDGPRSRRRSFIVMAEEKGQGS